MTFTNIITFILVLATMVSLLGVCAWVRAYVSDYYIHQTKRASNKNLLHLLTFVLDIAVVKAVIILVSYTAITETYYLIILGTASMQILFMYFVWYDPDNSLYSTNLNIKYAETNLTYGFLAKYNLVSGVRPADAFKKYVEST